MLDKHSVPQDYFDIFQMRNLGQLNLLARLDLYCTYISTSVFVRRTLSRKTH